MNDLIPHHLCLTLVPDSVAGDHDDLDLCQAGRSENYCTAKQ